MRAEEREGRRHLVGVASAVALIVSAMSDAMSRGVPVIDLRILQTLVSLITNFPSIHGGPLGAAARARVRWVSAIWEALDRFLSLPNHSQSGSPTGSIGTIYIAVAIDVPIDEPVDVLIDMPIGVLVETPIDVPIDVSIEAPINVLIDVPIEAPIDEPIDLHEEEEEELDLPPTPPPKTPSEVTSIISEKPALEPAGERPANLPGARDTDSSFSYTESDLSPAQPEFDTSVSSLTESSEPFVIASPRTVQTPVLSITDRDEEAVTPSVHPSQWPSETDVSFDSSALQPTPSIQSAALQEGIDGSFETSFMRPNVSPLSSRCSTHFSWCLRDPADDVDKRIEFAVKDRVQQIDQFRGQETQEIAENVRAIRDELYDLSVYVRTRLVAERSPPVPTRDTSVGGSSVFSTPRGPRPRYHPCRDVPTSYASLLPEFAQFELEAQTVERSYSISREPSWPSSSSSSSSPITLSEISSSEPSPGPSLSATSSSSTTPPPASPTPSTASTTTVRQRDSITIETLRDMLISLREQTAALWEGQVSTNHVLDELRETRSGPLDTTEFNDRFHAIEVILRQLINRRVETERPVHIQPPSESISDVGTDVDAEDFQQRWQDWTRLLRDRVPLAAPQPRRARGNIDDELLALLQAPTPQVPIGVQPPPALIPFAYQPAPVVFSPEIQHPPIHRPPRGPHVGQRLRDRPATETETVISGAPRPPTQQLVPPPGKFSNPRPPRRPTMPPPVPGMPPQPVIPGQQGGRRYVPMPPGPTVVQLPLFDTPSGKLHY
ncbi:hypothetical protein F4604DRAFT_1933098 [Suillus subluteus]|nr:hypothetical protein F4604DRAFT_1933098 [Suillus subluteus]